ncbi:autophagy-related protein 16-like isoform X1 [Pleurodeles waltl]|uniref:autophagy-related protein 16-like isoform X1 n=2 Tax=Pleurodeles waltl TaxID=8319 RepID=UPI0037099AEB
MELTWKRHIRAELQRRDRNQKEGYEGLLETYLKLLDRLDLQNFLAEKLQLETHRNDFSGSPTHHMAHETLCLEAAHLRIQHQLELTELLKARAELAETVLELNKTLQLKDLEIQDHRARISKQAQDISSLTKRYQDQKAYVEELEQQHQFLQDEHSVLQLTYLAMDERLQRTQGENKQLLARWMEEKAMEADRLNRHNEQEEKYGKLLAKLRRKLEKMKKSSMTPPAHAMEEPVTDPQSGNAASEHDCIANQEPSEVQAAVLGPSAMEEDTTPDTDSCYAPPEGDQASSDFLCTTDASLDPVPPGADGESLRKVPTEHKVEEVTQ